MNYKKFLVFIIILLIPCGVFASEVSTYGTYGDAKKIIKESMAQYYLRGKNIQYSYPRANYGISAPEEATYQDNKYYVCASYTYSSYVNAFKVSAVDDDFPRYNFDITDSGREYYYANKDNASKMNGNYLIYYQSNANSDEELEDVKYIYNNATSFSDFVELIKPGDLFAFTGHALIAYDVVTRNVDGETFKDVLILNSTGGGTLQSKISSVSSTGASSSFQSTSKLLYYGFATTSINNLIDIGTQGSIKFLWLSNYTRFVNGGKDGTISCSTDECAVIRMFYSDNYQDNEEVKFNYPIETDQYDKSLLRVKYTGLTIEKTSSMGDNNSVNIDDEITYTIKITNNSNKLHNSITYNNFVIEEIIDNKTKYVSSDNNGSVSNNIVKWNISSLGAGNSIELKYTVKVKEDYNNINEVINASGKFYDASDSGVYINTGNVDLKITNKVTKYKNTYKSCYESKKGSYSGLELIDEIYKCVTDYDFKFSDFEFSSIIGTTSTMPTTKGKSNVIFLNSENNTNKNYLKMILNNYWNALASYNDTSKNVIVTGIPAWSNRTLSSLVNDRAYTINSSDFKDGDVLIYKYIPPAGGTSYGKENGIYAYIYLEDENAFVGINYNGQDNQRNKYDYSYFTSMYSESEMNNQFYSYYTEYDVKNDSDLLSYINYQLLFGKDYYVIFRPELAMRELVKIDVDSDTNACYINEDNCLSNANLILTYSNNDKETVSFDDDSVTINGYDLSSLGLKNLTISYGGISTNFEINVIKDIDDIENPKTGSIILYCLITLVISIGFIILNRKYLSNRV